MSLSAPPDPLPRHRSRQYVLTGLMLLIPVLFFVLLEGGLRLIGYGNDYPLFKPLDEDPRYLVRNGDVARRYFSEHANVPAPLHDVFAAEKRDDEYRVFVQGGSTAAGFPFYHGGAFSRMLQHRLQQTFPDRTIEVVSTAMDAVSSYTLLDFADEIIAQQPDAVLIYAGHNEYYGALGVGSTESVGRFRGLVKTYLWLRRFRTVQLLRAILAGILSRSAGDDEGDSSTLMAQMAGEQLIPYGSPAYHLGLQQFRANLSDLLAKYEQADIPVFIATIASNERDQPPFETVFASGTDEKAWRGVYGRGTAALRRGDVSEARAAFTEATQMDSLAAAAFYALARVAEAAGDTAAARALFIAARDRDALRFRAPEAFNDIIRAVAATHGATVVEAQANIRRAAPGGTIGAEHMLEHLHPTAEGYFLIADAFYDALHAAGAIGAWSQPVGEQVARRETLLTPADSLAGLLRIRRMMAHWPFVRNGNAASRGDTLTVRTDFDRIVMALYRETEPWTEAMGELATYYERTGELDRAVQVRKAVVAAYPEFAQPYLGVGGVYLRAGRLDEAQRFFEDAAEREPRSVAPLSMLGVVALQRQDAARAIDYLERARTLEPRNTQTLYNLSLAYILSRRFEDARSTAEALLRAEPNHAQGRALIALLTSPHPPEG